MEKGSENKAKKQIEKEIKSMVVETGKGHKKEEVVTEHGNKEQRAG